MTIIHFKRNENEKRIVFVDSDGAYRIIGKDNRIGKRHEDFSEYYKSITEKGWRKDTERSTS
jgi:hypothetical protein